MGNENYKTEEKKQQNNSDIDFKKEIDSYFEASKGSNYEKLKNFTKYVLSQSITSFLSKNEIFKKILNIQCLIIECEVHLGGGLMSWAIYPQYMNLLITNKK